SDLPLPLGPLVPCGHPEDAIRIDLESDLDLGNMGFGGQDPFQHELPDLKIAIGFWIFSLKDFDPDIRLIVFACSVCQGRAGWNDGVLSDHRRELGGLRSAVGPD